MVWSMLPARRVSGKAKNTRSIVNTRRRVPSNSTAMTIIVKDKDKFLWIYFSFLLLAPYRRVKIFFFPPAAA